MKIIPTLKQIEEADTTQLKTWRDSFFYTRKTREESRIYEHIQNKLEQKGETRVDVIYVTGIF